MQFWKVNTWEEMLGGETLDLRGKELKYTAKNMHMLAGTTVGATASGLAMVSNCCGHFIVFHTSIVVRSGWDFLKQKLNPELCLRDT